VGRNLEKTVGYVELLEKTASIYYRALATGRPVTTLPDPIPTVLFEFVKREQDAEIARKDGRQQPG
jgi:ribulose-5-phosphate 4-epimerase/fuculose-1-phosphate aldolase